MSTRSASAFRRRAVGLACAFTPAVFAGGEVITVTTIDYFADAGGSIASLPGPDGKVSFQEAVITANLVPGPQTIEFAIPTSEFDPGFGQALLELQNPWSLTDDGTTIDFSTQDAFNGGAVGVYGYQPNGWGAPAIFVDADGCTIKGLGAVFQRGYAVSISGNNNRVIGCNISGPLHAAVEVSGGFGGPPATGNIIGGSLPGEGNTLSGGSAGVRIDGPADGNIVIGNTLVGSPFAGVEVRGASCCPGNTPYNTRIGGLAPGEANWIADNGKAGEQGIPLGEQVNVEWAVNTTIEGNIIGTTQDGAAKFPNGSGVVGIDVRASENTIIRGNLISGIKRTGGNVTKGVGIYVHDADLGVTIEGNKVGTDITGQAAIPNLFGIVIDWMFGYPAGGVIGGPDPDDANLIAFNERAGITIGTGVDNVVIQRNSIHSNDLLGIDLIHQGAGAGVTFNDPGDLDLGGNGAQNFPLLAAASSDGSTSTVEGSLDSHPTQDYRIEFFASSACDPSGFGEGERFLGDAIITSDAAGHAEFSVLVPEPATEGEVITATATRLATGDTSEFSACIPVIITADPPTMEADVNADCKVDSSDLNALLAAFGCAGDGCSADLNHDGVTDSGDLNVMLGSFGSFCQ